MNNVIAKEIIAAKGAALITMLLIVGIAFAVLLADRVGRIWQQVFGFCGCAAGLLLASLPVGMAGSLKIALIFAGFMLLNVMTNLGPNAQTYLLAGEVGREGHSGPLRLQSRASTSKISSSSIEAADGGALFEWIITGCWSGSGDRTLFPRSELHGRGRKRQLREAGCPAQTAPRPR